MNAQPAGFDAAIAHADYICTYRIVNCNRRGTVVTGAGPDGRVTGTCDRCNNGIRNIFVFRSAAGSYMHVGIDCADKMGVDAETLRAARADLRALKAELRAERRKIEREERVARAAEDRKVETAADTAFHAALAWVGAGSFGGFIDDIADKARAGQGLSARQREAFVDAVSKEQAKRDAMARQRAAGPIASGRRMVTGTIVKCGWKETAYGSRPVMTVEFDTGARVWGTMPSALFDFPQDFDEMIGMVIEMKATIEPKKPGFGFFKRPASVKVIDGAIEPTVAEDDLEPLPESAPIPF